MSQTYLHQYITIENKINVATNAGGNNMSKVIKVIMKDKYRRIKVQIIRDNMLLTVFNCSTAIPLKVLELDYYKDGEMIKNDVIVRVLEKLDWHNNYVGEDYENLDKCVDVRECLYMSLPMELQDRITLDHLLVARDEYESELYDINSDIEQLQAMIYFKK